MGADPNLNSLQAPSDSLGRSRRYIFVRRHRIIIFVIASKVIHIQLRKLFDAISHQTITDNSDKHITKAPVNKRTCDCAIQIGHLIQTMWYENAYRPNYEAIKSLPCEPSGTDKGQQTSPEPKWHVRAQEREQQSHSKLYN